MMPTRSTPWRFPDEVFIVVNTLTLLLKNVNARRSASRSKLRIGASSGPPGREGSTGIADPSSGRLAPTRMLPREVSSRPHV
jgi:hypothetical protein